jgi:hypothetical protein
MEKPKILLILISFFFILAFSYLLLKLEKKEAQIPGYKTYLKDTMADANTILQTYSTSLYKIEAYPSTKNKNETNTSNALFMESKIYAADANNHHVLYYQCDSSLSVTIYNKYGYPNTEDAKAMK